MWYVLYQGHVCGKSSMRNRFPIPHLKYTTYMFNTYVPIQNSFEFAKEIADQDPGLFMASLDVESLYMC